MVATVPIDDPGDGRIVDYVGLRDRERARGPSGGPDDGVLIAEGGLAIRQLLRSPYRLRSVLVSPRGLRALEEDLSALDAPVYLAPQELVEAICGFPYHRGALAAADRRALPDPWALARASGLVVAVEGVNDHENLGALFRNAAAFGAEAVLLDPTAADPLYRRAVRVSLGHTLRVPFSRVAGWPDSLAALRELGFEVVALTPAPGAEPLSGLRRRAPQALLVGAEGPGLSPGALAVADRRVRIPLAPEVDSLNVATAAAIALHHLVHG